MNKLIQYILFLAVVTLAACDEGRIYEEEIKIPQDGLTLKLTASLTGISSWPSSYQVVLGAFANETLSKYKLLDSSYEGKGTFSLTLSGIKDEITDVQLCVIERASRKSVIAYKTIEKADFNAVGDTIRLNAGELNVGMYNTIQEFVFDKKCIGCHGANSAPRGLHLTSGLSHGCLVNKPSASNPDYTLVLPGYATASLLPIVLNENGLLGHDHADMLDAREKSNQIALIKSWINAGADE